MQPAPATLNTPAALRRHPTALPHAAGALVRAALVAGAVLASAAITSTAIASTAAAPPPAAPPPTLGTPGAEVPRMVPLMGKRLFTPAGDEIGRVVDLIADPTFRPLAVVVDVGGFMGLGARRIAIAWSQLSLVPRDDAMRLVTYIPAEEIVAAPDYRPGDATSILSPSAAQ